MQRYGAEVAGGAEGLARRTAHALADAGHQVTVHTTTARDYLTWAAHYPAGAHSDGAVAVRRHTVDLPDPGRAADLVRALALRPGTAEEEAAWARCQGPVSRTMMADLAVASRAHDVVVAWTYLYATAQLAVPTSDVPVVLVPLAHDEPMLRFAISRGLTRSADALAFMTPEEALLVDDMHGVGGRPWEVVGTGVDPSPEPAWVGDGDFVLYVGRVDPAKGVCDLIDAHRHYRAAGGTLRLVLAGRPTVELDLPPWVEATGFIADADRDRLIRHARAVALPSRYESLSLAALEAWRLGCPTLTTAACDVVVGQTRRSGGGWAYRDASEYARILDRLTREPDQARAAGARAREWTAALTWDACVERWEHLLRRAVYTAPRGARRG